MDEADEGGSSSSRRTTTNPLDSFSKHLESFPRDLLQRFTSTTSTITTTTTATTAITSTSLSEYRTPNEETEELELSLGLSLGGRFGVDKSSKRLTRSTSIAGSFPLFREDEASATPSPLAHQPLVRSSSLPTETEEEWRKRKELQTLRRMEAKRRRSEKQRSLKIDKEDGRLEMESAQMGVLLAAKQGLGHSSSEGRSCLANQILQERSGQGAAGTSGPKAMGISIEEMRNPNTSESRSKEIGANAMEDMPCVFTKGEGPSGRRVDGILYKYGKGEEVRIMCICHGNFLSPSEFVRHAGGGDVAHPLRHIVVNPNPTAFPR